MSEYVVRVAKVSCLRIIACFIRFPSPRMP